MVLGVAFIPVNFPFVILMLTPMKQFGAEEDYNGYMDLCNCAFFVSGVINLIFVILMVITGDMLSDPQWLPMIVLGTIFFTFFPRVLDFGLVALYFVINLYPMEFLAVTGLLGLKLMSTFGLFHGFKGLLHRTATKRKFSLPITGQ